MINKLPEHILSVMGPTGAGKSTVSHHFSRIQMVQANSVKVN